MSKQSTAGVVGVFATVIALDFGLTWGVVHMAAELLQEIGLYAWEPTYLATAGIAVVIKLVKTVL